MPEIPSQIGRWALGDFAHDRANGKLYKVIGFIMSPSIVFREIPGEGSGDNRVEVPGSLIEQSLEQYRRTEAKA